MCTANVCRSPLAAGLLTAQLGELCVPATVRSAGLLDGGRPAAPEGVAVLAGRSIDISSHVSRRLAPEEIRGADLILGMAAEHVRAVVALDAEVWQRTFTLKELVRRGDQVGPRAPGQELEDWLTKLDVGREHRDLLADTALDDLADPVNRPYSAFAATADELERLVVRMVDLIWGVA